MFGNSSPKDVSLLTYYRWHLWNVRPIPGVSPGCSALRCLELSYRLYLGFPNRLSPHTFHSPFPNPHYTTNCYILCHASQVLRWGVCVSMRHNPLDEFSTKFTIAWNIEWLCNFILGNWQGGRTIDFRDCFYIWYRHRVCDNTLVDVSVLCCFRKCSCVVA